MIESSSRGWLYMTLYTGVHTDFSSMGVSTERFPYPNESGENGPFMDMLQTLGDQGWELCGFHADRAYLKRAKPPQQAEEEVRPLFWKDGWKTTA